MNICEEIENNLTVESPQQSLQQSSSSSSLLPQEKQQQNQLATIENLFIEHTNDSNSQKENDDDNKSTKSFSNYIYVEDFLIYNKHSSNLNIFYLISLDLIQLRRDQLNICKNDTRFFEIESLDVNVHYAKHTAISYCAKFGFGYKMPNIRYYRSSS